MAERGGHETGAVQGLGPVVAEADTAGVVLQPLDRSGQCYLAGGDDAIRQLRAQCGQDRDGLRDREREVEPRHRAIGGSENGTVRGGAGEDLAELFGRNFAVEIEHVGAPARPPAGRLATADVVVLGAPGDGVEVVALAAWSQLGQRQHQDRPGRG
jgi:hypothetical protein